MLVSEGLSRAVWRAETSLSRAAFVFRLLRVALAAFSSRFPEAGVMSESVRWCSVFMQSTEQTIAAAERVPPAACNEGSGLLS